MALHVPPVITKVELEAALLPNDGETVAELEVRARAAGYTIMEVREDRIVVLHTLEEA